VQDAVSEVKKRNKILVVSVQDSNTESTNLDQRVWTSERVAANVREKAVVLRLIEGTEDANNFKSLCPVITFPTIYILSCSGLPLGILSGKIDEAELVEKLESAFRATQQQQTPPQPSGTTRAARSSQRSQTAPTSEQTRSKSSSSGNVAAKPEQTSRAGPSEESSRGSAGSDIKSPNDRQKSLKSTPSQDIPSEKRPTRSEARRADPATQTDKRSKGESVAETPTKQVQPAASTNVRKNTGTQVQPKDTQLSRSSDSTRLSIKFPNNDKLQHNFNRTDKFIEVRRFISASHPGRLCLICHYPKIEFADSDDEKTLEELGLHPSAAVIATKPSGGAGGPHVPSLGSFDLNVLTFVRRLFGWFRALLGNLRLPGTTRITGTASSSESSHSRSAAGSNSTSSATNRFGAQLRTFGDYSGQPSQGPAGWADNLRKRFVGDNESQGSSQGIRRQGNITGFGPPSDDKDDEQRFWNGNSTQFNEDGKRK